MSELSDKIKELEQEAARGWDNPIEVTYKFRDGSSHTYVLLDEKPDGTEYTMELDS